MREYSQDKNTIKKNFEKDTTTLTESVEARDEKPSKKSFLNAEFIMLFFCILVGVLACITIASTLNGGNAIEKSMYKSCVEKNPSTPEDCAGFKPTNNEESK